MELHIRSTFHTDVRHPVFYLLLAIILFLGATAMAQSGLPLVQLLDTDANSGQALMDVTLTIPAGLDGLPGPDSADRSA